MHEHKYIDPDTEEERSCGDEGVLCDEHQSEEAAYWLAEFGGWEVVQRRAEERRFYKEHDAEFGLL